MGNMKRIHAKGSKVETKRLTVSTDSNRIGYPETAIEAGSVGVVVSGPAPYVNRQGMFYKVEFGAQCLAVDSGNLRKHSPTKTAKRIHKVVVKRMVDESPDTSWLGEYADSPTSEYSIDREHSLDCPVNTGEMPDSFMKDCVTDKQRWLQVETTAGTYFLPQELHVNVSNCPADEVENNPFWMREVSQYVEGTPQSWEWIVGYGARLSAPGYLDCTEWTVFDTAEKAEEYLRETYHDDDAPECDCGGHGDRERGQYQYFNPSVDNYKGLSPEDMRKVCQSDYERMERLNRGEWCFIGIAADAEYCISDDPHKRTNTSWTVQSLHSGGLWGIESDSDASYLAEVEQEQLAELREQLKAIGFSSRAISAAFRNVERVDG